MRSPDNDKFYGYLSNFDQDKNIQYREDLEEQTMSTEILGEIHPKLQTVVSLYSDALNQMETGEYENAIQKVIQHCEKKYINQDQLVSCIERTSIELPHLSNLYETLLLNFGNKCLHKGNSIDFCTQAVLKEEIRLRPELFKRFYQIREYL